MQANTIGGGSIRTTVAVVVSSQVDAVGDTATLDLGLGQNFIDINVASNDNFEADEVKYTIAAGGYPSNGSLSVVNTNTGVFRYTPDAGFSGTDTFVYRATPTGGKSEIGTVNITVIPV